MSKEIKTRQIHKDIKVINKAVVGTERVREAYVRTKESAEQAQNKASPEEYAYYFQLPFWRIRNAEN